MSDCCLRFSGIRHFNKRKTAGLPGIAIGNNIYALHAAVLRKRGLEFILSSSVTEITDKNVGHSVWVLLKLTWKLSLFRLHWKPTLNRWKVAAGKHSEVNTDALKDKMSLAEEAVRKLVLFCFSALGIIACTRTGLRRKSDPAAHPSDQKIYRKTLHRKHIDSIKRIYGRKLGECHSVNDNENLYEIQRSPRADWNRH